MSHSVTHMETPASVQAPRQALPASPPNLFDYQDYRAWLKELIQARQRADASFTLAHFAKAIGFSSHAGLAMVLTGKRELKDPYLEKCSRFLKLNFKQRLYFEAMVRAGSLSPEKRRALLRETEFYTSNWAPPEPAEGMRLIDFGIVQQVLALHRGHVKPARIQAYFRYEIAPAELKAILDYMLAKGYVSQSPEGYRVNKSVLLIPDEIPNASGKQLHKDCLRLAAQALDEDPIDAREFQTYLLTVDSKRIPEMKKKIKKLVIEAISEFEDELDGDTVVQAHFNLFQMTRRNDETTH